MGHSDTVGRKHTEMSMSFNQRLNAALVALESRNGNSEILQELDAVSKRLGIPVTVIGGMAVGAHGYQRFTADIDILIASGAAPQFANTLLQQGRWVDVGNNKLKEKRSGVLLNFCAEGVKAGRVTFPPPEVQTPGVNVASLPLLLSLKVMANRQKDRADVVELIKANNLSEDYLAANVLPLLQNSMDHRLVTALWKMAVKEMGE